MPSHSVNVQSCLPPASRKKVAAYVASGGQNGPSAFGGSSAKGVRYFADTDLLYCAIGISGTAHALLKQFSTFVVVAASVLLARGVNGFTCSVLNSSLKLWHC